MVKENPIFNNTNMLYETLRHLNYFEIIKTCQSDRTINNLCRNDKLFQELLIKKRNEKIHEYSTKYTDLYHYLIMAYSYDDLSMINEINALGIDPSQDGNKVLLFALHYNQTRTIKRLLNDPHLYYPNYYNGKPGIGCLDLSNRKLDDNHINALSKALKDNIALTCLDLSNNNITNKGASALAAALETNKTLISLNLSNNRIGDIGATELRNMLIGNKTLTNINLDLNYVADMRPEIEKLIRRNLNLVDNFTVSVKSGDLNKVQHYLSQGISLLSSDSNGNTPLHWAVLYKNADMAAFLLNEMRSRLLPINIKNNKGQTAKDLGLYDLIS